MAGSIRGSLNCVLRRRLDALDAGRAQDTVSEEFLKFSSAGRTSHAGAYNRLLVQSIRRILIVAPLVPWLALSAVLAREHVHESDSADHAAVAHSHFAPHIHGDHEIATHDHDGAEVSDVDEHVVWLDEVGIAETTRSFPPLLVALPTHLEIVQQRLVRVAVIPDEATLPHGPPRVSLSLRAPPSASL